ncbi:MAG: hypothetical protein WC058_12575 [Phycisphaeraceae bacterium]
MRFDRLDRRAFSVTSLNAQSDERAYWRSVSPADRLRTVEFLRQQQYGYDPATARLQRVFEVAQLERR